MSAISGEDFAFDRRIDALTLAIILAVLILLLGGAFLLVAAVDQPASAVGPRTEAVCPSRRPNAGQEDRTDAAGMPGAISGP